MATEERFAERLRRLRKQKFATAEKDGTAEDLAEAAGVRTEQVSRWENGAGIGRANARKLAKALGVSVEWLLEGDEPAAEATDADAITIPGHIVRQGEGEAMQWLLGALARRGREGAA